MVPIAGTVTRDFAIDLPADRVDAHGDAYVCATEGCTSTPTRTIGAYRFCGDCAQDLRLPSCPAQGPTEGALGHGLRILAFLLAEGVYATLSDLELERADYAAGFAVTSREILPLAVDRISDVRHVIAATLKTRRAWDAPATCTTPVDPDRRPPEGPMARLEPQPITRSPAGGAVRPMGDRIQF